MFYAFVCRRVSQRIKNVKAITGAVCLLSEAIAGAVCLPSASLFGSWIRNCKRAQSDI